MLKDILVLEKSDLNKMLKTIGVKSLDDLIQQTIPDDILLQKKLSLQDAMTEKEYLEHSNELASKRQVIQNLYWFRIL